jgi:Glycosyltransferase family 87
VALDLRSNRGRVQSAILFYLLGFAGLNLLMWGRFAFHIHGAHRFPLGNTWERFGDLLHFSGKYQVWKDPHMGDFDHLTGTLFPQNYPPLAVVVYLFLLQVCAPYAVPVMLGTVLAGMGVACTLLWRRVRRLGGYRWYMGVAIFATGLFGWGTEQVVLRGNIEGLMWIGVCLGAALLARRQFTGAAVAFGISSCLKPYPVLWFILLARHRKYREAAIGLLTAMAVTLASLLVIDRNLLRAYRHISGNGAGSRAFFEKYIVGLDRVDGMEITGDHSLFHTIKTMARVIRNHGLKFPVRDYMVQSNDPLAWKLYHAYLPLAVVIGLVVLWRVWNKPLLNQIFALACVTMVLPLVAGDYTLTLLLVPMGFFLIFLLEDVAGGKVPMSLGRMLWFLMPCAWMMGTEPLVTLHGVFKCVALLVLLAVSVLIPLPSTLFGEIEPVSALQPDDATP